MTKGAWLDRILPPPLQVALAGDIVDVVQDISTLPRQLIQDTKEIGISITNEYVFPMKTGQASHFNER